MIPKQEEAASEDSLTHPDDAPREARRRKQGDVDQQVVVVVLVLRDGLGTLAGKQMPLFVRGAHHLGKSFYLFIRNQLLTF